MKKITVIIVLLISSPLFAQEIQYRVSESTKKQKDISYSQDGVLLRFDHEELQKTDIENKKENYWGCKELWIPKNTKSDKIQSFVQTNFPEMKSSDLNKIMNDYSKVKIDEIAKWKQKDIVEKLIELEGRLEKLEKP